MSCVLSTAKLVCPDVFRAAKQTNKMQVVTIANSHFCELACWALEVAQIPYQEHAYMPGQHILPTMVVRVGGPQKHLASSSKMSTAKTNDDSTDSKEPLSAEDKDPNPSSVPIAVLPDGSVLLDSWEIAAHSGLPSIDDELKQWLDVELGPCARQLVYGYILKPSNKNIADELFTHYSGWMWHCAYFFAGGAIKGTIAQQMKPFDAAANKICRECLDRVVEQISQRLRDRQSLFLGGKSLGVADIALASLMAPLVSPAHYMRGGFAPIFDRLAQQDREVLEDVQHWRSTVAGEYVMEMYQKYRVV